jgi:hypothetical protein
VVLSRSYSFYDRWDKTQLSTIADSLPYPRPAAGGRWQWGARTIEQLEGALRALDVHLEAEVLVRLDKIFPGPGGPTPEAYAW